MGENRVSALKKCALIMLSLCAMVQVSAMTPEPLCVAKSIGDKLIANTRFSNRLVLRPTAGSFSGLQVVDFAKTFGEGAHGVVYAYTNLTSNADTDLTVQAAHSGKCRIWLNGHQVYSGSGPDKVNLVFDERSVELDNRLTLSVKRGVNTLLVESQSTGESINSTTLMPTGREWIFYIQPEPDKMKVSTDSKPEIGIGLSSVENIDKKIADISDWLVCGIFDAANVNDELRNNVAQSVDSWGCMFDGVNGQKITWSLPRIDVIGDVINPVEWGTPYNWNYHNGGTAWAMQVLTEESGEQKYEDFASDFCNYHLRNIPFVAYQVDDLKAFECANHHIYKTPLLDFTLAPSLPYIYKLAGQSAAERDSLWSAWVDDMITYSDKQIRLPGGVAYTRTTPEVYTTWVDDMFMGIPFLVHATRYTGDTRFINDAVAQVFDFNKQVWDEDVSLYMHARYSGRDAKCPHWSRANGWGVWAVSEVLSYLSPKSPSYKKLLNHYRRHVNGLVKYQNDNGFWYNVLEYPESREEVSGTAIFTMAIARGIRNGWLDRQTFMPIVEKAWRALNTKISSDGTVKDICYGTMCSEDVNYYINRPFYIDDTHGLFAVLFACIEMHRLYKALNLQ